MTGSISRRDLLHGGRHRPAAKDMAVIGEHCLALTGVSCRLCEDACAPHAIRFRPRLGGHYHPRVEAEACTGCADCIPVCPVGAILIETGARADV
jgi:ferredoxin-type protein NapF